jgi:hypothetical protein
MVALAVAGLTLLSSAQKLQKPKAKPSHNEERESSKKTARTGTGKEPTSRTSASQELRRVEQSSAKVSPARKAESTKAARSNPALKTQKKDGNPPIHFASSGHSGKSGGKSGDELKGRLRQKGHR